MLKLVKILGMLVIAQAAEVETTAESELTATAEVEAEAECEVDRCNDPRCVCINGYGSLCGEPCNDCKDGKCGRGPSKFRCRKTGKLLCPGGKCGGKCGGSCLSGCKNGKCIKKGGLSPCHCIDTMKKGKDCGCHGKELINVVKTVSYGDHNCPIKRSADGRCPIKTRKPVAIKTLEKKDCSCKTKKLVLEKEYDVKVPLLKSVHKSSKRGHISHGLHPRRRLSVVSHDLKGRGLGLGLKKEKAYGRASRSYDDHGVTEKREYGRAVSLGKKGLVKGHGLVGGYGLKGVPIHPIRGPIHGAVNLKRPIGRLSKSAKLRRGPLAHPLDKGFNRSLHVPMGALHGDLHLDHLDGHLPLSKSLPIRKSHGELLVGPSRKSLAGKPLREPLKGLGTKRLPLPYSHGEILVGPSRKSLAGKPIREPLKGLGTKHLPLAKSYGEIQIAPSRKSLAGKPLRGLQTKAHYKDVDGPLLGPVVSLHGGPLGGIHRGPIGGIKRGPLGSPLVGAKRGPLVGLKKGPLGHPLVGAKRGPLGGPLVGPLKKGTIIDAKRGLPLKKLDGPLDSRFDGKYGSPLDDPLRPLGAPFMGPFGKNSLKRLSGPHDKPLKSALAPDNYLDQKLSIAGPKLKKPLRSFEPKTDGDFGLGYGLGGSRNDIAGVIAPRPNRPDFGGLFGLGSARGIGAPFTQRKYPSKGLGVNYDAPYGLAGGW